MSLFFRKTKDHCLDELNTVSEYISQTFQAKINLSRLHEQVENLIDSKIADYNYNRFKDWTVADLILLSSVIEEKVTQEKQEQKGRKKN